MSVETYAEAWLTRLNPQLRRTTRAMYAYVLRRYILPTAGPIAVVALTRRDVRGILLALADGGIGRSTLRLIHTVLHSMLNDAIEADVIEKNPAARVGRTWMRRLPSEPKAMTGAQLAAFLGAARDHQPRHYPLLLAMAHGGLRIGEALALQQDDLDVGRLLLRVERSAHPGGWIGPTKSGRLRWVDLTETLAAVLASYASRAAPWLFPSNRGGPRRKDAVERAMRGVCEVLGLHGRFTPHSLRHTYASLLIAAGAPMEYVRRQLGHTSIRMTVDTYGSHLPMTRSPALAVLEQR